MSRTGWIRRDILKFLRDSTPIDTGAPPITTREIAVRVCASETAVRKHLISMQEDGLVVKSDKEGWSTA